MVDRCLKDASLAGLSSDQKYILSYQAAFETAIVLLYKNGYKAIKTGHHYIVWQCMKEILPKGQHKAILIFEAAAKKRSKLSYDIAGLASQQEASEMYQETVKFIEVIKEKIKTP